MIDYAALPQTAEDNAPLLAMLKWPGGKRWLVPYLRPIWEQHSHRRYVEPFVGSASVAFGLRPQRALVNDINPFPVSFYRAVQRGLEIDIPMRSEAELYYAARARLNILHNNGAVDSPEVAKLFYYINHTCFNGLFRTNRKGEFNASWGKYKHVEYSRTFPDHERAMASWKITRGSYTDVPYEPNDFIYADPPYDVVFTRYSKEGFTWDDQIEVARRFSYHPGPVALSNQATPRIVELYEQFGYTLTYHEVARKINTRGDGRGHVREVLALRNMETETTRS